MHPPSAEMWNTYLFRRFTVMIVERWKDPFGEPMVRIVEIGTDQQRAEGMSESAFLAEAVPVAAARTSTSFLDEHL